MNIRAWQLPWKEQWVPHALLDVLRGCNISCRACYNTEPPQAKSLDQIQDEFEIMRRHRRLDSISVVGGEPTIHPQLIEIVRLVKAADVSVELFTNGLLLERELLSQLKEVGTDLVFLHIDAHQNRPDLDATVPQALAQLRAAKAAEVAAADIEVGLSITAYPDALGEVDEAIEFVLSSPHVDYLVVTLFRNVPAIPCLKGCLETGFRGEPIATQTDRQSGLTNELLAVRLHDRFGLLPFAYVGSNLDNQDLRWVSYPIGDTTRHEPTMPDRGVGAVPTVPQSAVGIELGRALEEQSLRAQDATFTKGMCQELQVRPRAPARHRVENQLKPESARILLDVEWVTSPKPPRQDEKETFDSRGPQHGPGCRSVSAYRSADQIRNPAEVLVVEVRAHVREREQPEPIVQPHCQ